MRTVLLSRLMLGALLISFPAVAFRKTVVDSYTDPDYVGYSPKIVVLLVAEAPSDTRREIEEYLTTEMAKHGVTVIPFKRLFTPTRVWSEEDQKIVYEREKVDSGLIVTQGASSSSVIPIATQTYGSGSVFGTYGTNGTFSGSGHGSSTTYNIMGAKSKADFSAVLLDLSKNRTIWYADVTVKAGGTLFVSEKGDGKGLVKGVVRTLIDDRHIPE